MQRRDLLKFAALGAGATAAHALGRTLLAPDAPISGVRRVLVAFKCHLDVGFTSTQAAVMQKYFNVYYPQAIETGAVVRVPLFVNEGDVLRIDTRTGEYVSRAKG